MSNKLIKKYIKRFLSILAPKLYIILHSILDRNHASKFEHSLGLDHISRLFAKHRGLTVLDGPFKGMKYTNSAVACRHATPKLLGSYEKEIHGFLKIINTTQYKDIVNVGCAEGYYSIGLARTHRGVPIYSFDANPFERSICSQVAKANKVSSQINIKGVCTAKDLQSILNDRSLVFCDCEGCEIQLLNPKFVPALRYCDILVELHDNIVPNLTPLFISRFKKTHNISRVIGVKRNPKDYPAINFLRKKDRNLAINEYRSGIQNWAFMRPKYLFKKDN